MKKKLFWLGLVVCIFCLIRIDAVAQDGKWKWVRASGTTEAAYTNSVATDSKENVYVGGGYSSKITFGTYTLKGNIYQNIFIAKYDSMGRVLWAKTNEGGNYYDVATSIITDDSGFIYLCGYFRSAYLKFDTFIVKKNVTHDVSQDMFVAKFDSNGKTIWLKSAGGDNEDYATSIAKDTKGGIYLTGYTASDSITLSGKTHLNNGYGDFFIVKYSSRGQMEWVKFAKCNYYDIVEGIITDKTGNVYATGAFRGDSILFDSIKLLHSKSDYGYSNIFIVKYNSKGKVIWAKSGDNNDYDNDASTGITIDNSGNIAVTGYFKGSSIKFDAVTLTRKKNGIDIFIAKYDSNGILQWAKDIGDSLQIANTNCITSDTVGNIFIAGSFTSPKMYLDSIYLINSSYGQKDIFIAQLNLNGKVIWAKSAGGSYNDDRAWSISKGTSNSIYIGGDIWSSVVYFDKDSVITKSKWNDMFLAKLSYSNSTSIFNPPPPHQTQSATLYPNPARQTITINTKQSIQKTEVFNLAGVLVTTANNTNTLNVEALPKGMYFVKIYTTQGVQNIKFVRE